MTTFLHTLAGWIARLWELDCLAGEIEGSRFAYAYACVLAGPAWAECRQQQERRIARYNEIRFWWMHAKTPN